MIGSSKKFDQLAVVLQGSFSVGTYWVAVGTFSVLHGACQNLVRNLCGFVRTSRVLQDGEGSQILYNIITTVSMIYIGWTDGRFGRTDGRTNGWKGRTFWDRRMD